MIKQAIFAGGCFWGMEAKFKHVQGVVNTMVGYTGGPGCLQRSDWTC